MIWFTVSVVIISYHDVPVLGLATAYTYLSIDRIVAVIMTKFINFIIEYLDNVKAYY